MDAAARRTSPGRAPDEPGEARLLVGTSGWSYRHWRGVFYPAHLPARDWLRFYAQRFSTVELNTSFYHWPRGSSFAAWRDRLPGGYTL